MEEHPPQRLSVPYDISCTAGKFPSSGCDVFWLPRLGNYIRAETVRTRCNVMYVQFPDPVKNGQGAYVLGTDTDTDTESTPRTGIGFIRSDPMRTSVCTNVPGLCVRPFVSITAMK